MILLTVFGLFVTIAQVTLNVALSHLGDVLVGALLVIASLVAVAGELHGDLRGGPGGRPLHAVSDAPYESDT